MKLKKLLEKKGFTVSTYQKEQVTYEITKDNIFVLYVRINIKKDTISEVKYLCLFNAFNEEVELETVDTKKKLKHLLKAIWS